MADAPGGTDVTQKPLIGAGQVLLPSAPPDPHEPGESHDRLADLYRLGDPALSELSFEALLDEILTRIRDILAVDTVAVLLRDDSRGGHELLARAAKGLEEEVRQGVRIPIGRGFAGRIAANRAPIFIPNLDEADVVNPILAEIGIKSLLGVPLIVEGQLLGVMHIGSLTPRNFTPTDAGLLELAAARVAPAIERADLFAAFEREHRAALALQRSLLPDSLPDLMDVEAAVRYLPARDEVGGDWYDVLPLPRNRVGIVIGDVAGHGVRAAALMAQLRSALRAYALDGHEPAEVLRRLDRLLQATQSTGMATAAFAMLDPIAGVVTIASAGHLPAIVADRDGARAIEGPVYPPLGVRPYADYGEIELELGYDEALLLYTDGLVEIRGEPVSHGIARLVAAAQGDPLPDRLCTRVVQQMVGDRATEDDVAIVAVTRVPPSDELHLSLPAESHVLAPMRRRMRAWLRAHEVAEDDARTIVLAAGEACANAIEHAYSPMPSGFEVRARAHAGTVEIRVRDRGRWREPRGSDRGRGLSIMRATMDHVEVTTDARGTEVVLRRQLGGER